MEINLILSSLISGGLVLISFLKITQTSNENKKGNIYFGIFALLWASFWLDELILPRNETIEGIPYIALKFVQFLTPLIFYISIIFYTNPSFKYKIKDLTYLPVPIIFILLLLFKPQLEPHIFSILYLILFLGHALFYTSKAYLRVNRHQKDIELFSSDKESIDLNWIKYIIYSFFGCLLLLILMNLFEPIKSLNIYLNLFFLTVVYFVSYYSVKQKEIYPQGLDIDDTLHIEVSRPLNPEGKVKLMSDLEMEEVKGILLNLMEVEKPYLDSELNLVRLSEKLNISSHQLSYVLNNGLHENFFNFINRYRVSKAKDYLSDPKYDYLTIVAIGFEAGFNSKTAFNTTFKKMTSYTPTAYKIKSNLKS